MINPLHTKTFLQLCTTLHFTRTAETLNMTQPGVSQHLKALENELGVSLFFRRGKTIELTAQGAQLRQFLIAQQEAENDLRNRLAEDSPHAGEISISCSGSMAMILYPQLLELQEKHLKLVITLEAAPNERAINLVRNKQCDLALVTSVVSDPGLDIEELGNEALCLALPKGYDAQWSDLLELGFIDHPNGAHYATQVFEKNYSQEFTGFKNFPKKGYINQLSQILTPVSRRLGFSILPQSTVDSFPDLHLITKAQLPNLCCETIYIITKKYTPLPKRYTMVKDCLTRLWGQRIVTKQQNGIAK